MTYLFNAAVVGPHFIEQQLQKPLWIADTLNHGACLQRQLLCFWNFPSSLFLSLLWPASSHSAGGTVWMAATTVIVNSVTTAPNGGQAKIKEAQRIGQANYSDTQLRAEAYTTCQQTIWVINNFCHHAVTYAAGSLWSRRWKLLTLMQSSEVDGEKI